MKHLLRRLFRSPMFTGITLLTLAIGIGANTAVFSVVEAVLLKPLPYPQPGELISVVHKAPGLNLPELPSSPSCYFTYREEGRSFQSIGLWQGDSDAVTGLAEPEQVPAVNVTHDILPMLGGQPVLGRAFTKQDDTFGAPATVILSYGYWQRKFAGDRNILGRSLTVDSKPRLIIGVLPPHFRIADRDSALFLPFQFERDKLSLGNFSYQSIARLKPGVTLAQATADIDRMVPIVNAKFPPPSGASRALFENARFSSNLRLFKDDVVGDVGRVLWVLMGTIGIVLLIACANVANLLLVRAEGRQQELAIRAALGAGWTRIAGELLLECVTLGIAGGVLGVAVAYGALRALVAAAPDGLPRLAEIGLDPVVLLFALGISLLAGVLFGLIPIFKYAGPQISGAIRHGGRTLSQSRERHRARSTLVVVQVALALVLLVGAGLMIRTFQAMRHVQPGFTDPQHLQTVVISIPEEQVKDSLQVVRMQHAIVDRIAALPGVTAVSFAGGVPMDNNNSFDPVFAEDHPLAEGKLPGIRRYKFAAPGFLNTLGNPLIAGRDYTWTDVNNLAPFAIVTENLAREMWGDPRAAIGKRIRESLDGPWREIIGVAGNERDDGVDHKSPTSVYWPILTKGFWGKDISVRRTITLAVRSTRTGSQSFVDEIRRSVWAVDRDIPLAGIKTMQEIYERSMARTSFALVMLAVAGAMALLLGIIGIYGVISYSVSQRTREIGIRMALGAQQPALTAMFVGHGLRLAAIGLGCGLAAAFALTRGMSSLLFGINAADPITYIAVSLGLALAAAAASYIPSRRATAIDPMEALRAE